LFTSFCKCILIFLLTLLEDEKSAKMPAATAQTAEDKKAK